MENQNFELGQRVACVFHEKSGVIVGIYRDFNGEKFSVEYANDKAEIVSRYFTASEIRAA